MKSILFSQTSVLLFLAAKRFANWRNSLRRKTNCEMENSAETRILSDTLRFAPCNAPASQSCFLKEWIFSRSQFTSILKCSEIYIFAVQPAWGKVTVSTSDSWKESVFTKRCMLWLQRSSSNCAEPHWFINQWPRSWWPHAGSNLVTALKFDTEVSKSQVFTEMWQHRYCFSNTLGNLCAQHFQSTPWTKMVLTIVYGNPYKIKQRWFRPCIQMFWHCAPQLSTTNLQCLISQSRLRWARCPAIVAS